MSDVPTINSDWQSNGSLSDSLWYMFENQVMCDIVFEVGKEYERIGAHSTVLAARSSTLLKQFVTDSIQESEIELDDVQPKHFKLFLKYLYTGQVTIDNSDKEAVRGIAERYNVTRLADLIIAETLSSFTPGDFCNYVRKYEQFTKEVQAKCLNFVFDEPSEVFNCPEFVVLPYSFLYELLDHEYLVLEEETICTAVLLWATRACEDKNLEVNGENQRAVLNDILYLVRFPLISQDFFTENISEKGLLTPKEEIQLLKIFLNSRSDATIRFNREPRIAPELPFIKSQLQSGELSLTDKFDSFRDSNSSKLNEVTSSGSERNTKDVSTEKQSATGTLATSKSVQVMRFTLQGQGWGYRNNKKDAIAFTSSKDITMESIFVYGCTKNESKVEVTVMIKEGDNQLLMQNYKFDCMKSQAIYEVELDKAVKIYANQTYHIVIAMNADTGFFGKGGEKSFNNGDVIVAFKRSKFSTNNTTESIGQIPGFKYRLD